MSFVLPAQGLHVPAGEGPAKWFSGDVYTVKLEAKATNGTVGLIEASVPPGGGPPPHIHNHADETFYLLNGELEFLEGERTFTARTGDLVFVPRGATHRFLNTGIRTATMLFFYTPGGPEGLFLEGGDDPKPGVQVEPWGPDRFGDHMTQLLDKYDNVILPPSVQP